MTAGHEVVIAADESPTVPLLRQMARGRWALLAVASAGLIPTFFQLISGLSLVAMGHWVRGRTGLWDLAGLAAVLAIVSSVAFLVAGLLTLALPPDERSGAPDVRPVPEWPWLSVSLLRRTLLGTVATGLVVTGLAWWAATETAVAAPSRFPTMRTAWGVLVGAAGPDLPAALGLCLATLLVALSLGGTGDGGARARLASRPCRRALPQDPEPLPPPGDSVAVVTAEPMATTVTAPCPVCGCPVGPDPVVCERCGTPHHGDCFEYAGGCAIFGCGAGALRPRSSSPSSLPSSSSPSSSPPPDLSRDVATWLRLYRAHWTALCVTVTGAVLVVWFAALPLDPLYGFLLEAFAGFGSLCRVAGLVMAGVALPAYGLLLALEAQQRGRLNGLATVQAPPSGRATRALVDRLDPVAPGARLHTLLAVLALGSVSLAIINLLAPLAWWWASWGSSWAPPFGPIPVLALLAFATGLPVALLHASVVRAAHVRSLQNRLAATLSRKGKGG